MGIDFTQTKVTRADLMNEFRARNIWTQVHYIPVHLHPYYQERFGYKKGDFPAAEAYYNKAISLPLFPALKDKDIQYVVENLLDTLKTA